MIHYHGTPVGGKTEDAVRLLRGRHGLVSYARSDDIGIVSQVCQSFVLDNGAFTAWRQGKEFDFEGYAGWVLSLYRHPGFDFCLVPDVIDGEESDNIALQAQWLNGTRNKGVRSYPVFHFHESLEYLVSLIAQAENGVWDGLALGSSAGYEPNTRKWWSRMSEIMDVVCVDGYPRVRLHGLRMLDPDVFTRIPLSSADSTNAAVNSGSLARYGSYKPPTAGQRAEVIAARIEAHNSAPVWQHFTQGDMYAAN